MTGAAAHGSLAATSACACRSGHLASPLCSQITVERVIGAAGVKPPRCFTPAPWRVLRQPASPERGRAMPSLASRRYSVARDMPSARAARVACQ